MDEIVVIVPESPSAGDDALIWSEARRPRLDDNPNALITGDAGKRGLERVLPLDCVYVRGVDRGLEEGGGQGTGEGVRVGSGGVARERRGAVHVQYEGLMYLDHLHEDFSVAQGAVHIWLRMRFLNEEGVGWSRSWHRGHDPRYEFIRVCPNKPDL